MIGAFRTGEDIHTITASQVFGVEPDQVTGEMRRRAKAVNFGIVYGISDFSLSQDIGVTRAEAKAYMEKYFEKYSGVHAYMTQVVERAKERLMARNGMTEEEAAAQAEAAALLAADPLLEAPEHSLLAAQVEQMFTKAGAMN